MRKRKTILEFIRFSIVGAISTFIEYVIYWIFQYWINVNIAFTFGYFISFLANYYLTVHFTFKEKVSAKNGIGFSGAHIINYFLHIILLNIVIEIGVPKEIALIPVYAIAVPLNYFIVRFVFKNF